MNNYMNIKLDSVQCSNISNYVLFARNVQKCIVVVHYVAVKWFCISKKCYLRRNTNIKEFS